MSDELRGCTCGSAFAGSWTRSMEGAAKRIAPGWSVGLMHSPEGILCWTACTPGQLIQRQSLDALIAAVEQASGPHATHG